MRLVHTIVAFGVLYPLYGIHGAEIPSAPLIVLNTELTRIADEEILTDSQKELLGADESKVTGNADALLEFFKDASKREEMYGKLTKIREEIKKIEGSSKQKLLVDSRLQKLRQLQKYFITSTSFEEATTSEDELKLLTAWSKAALKKYCDKLSKEFKQFIIKTENGCALQGCEHCILQTPNEIYALVHGDSIARIHRVARELADAILPLMGQIGLSKDEVDKHFGSIGMTVGGLFRAVVAQLEKDQYLMWDAARKTELYARIIPLKEKSVNQSAMDEYMAERWVRGITWALFKQELEPKPA